MTTVQEEHEEQPPADESPRVFTLEFSGPGLLVAALFFALSLAPSLLPRGALFQGIVSGVTLMIGYGIGVVGQWAWRYLGLPVPERGSTTQSVIVWVAVGGVGLFTILSIWRQVGWQNDVRDIFGEDPVSPAVWLVIVPVTLIVAGLILIISRSLRKLFRWAARWLEKITSRRAARLIGGIAVVLLVLTLVNGVLIEGFFTVANQAFSVRDTDTVEGVTQPQDPERSGSPESLVAWDTLGRQGRSFTATGPSVDELNEFHGGGALVPIRVYVGLKSADTLQARADLVLEELKRTGAFDREALIVATTTGTGFLEPAAMQSFEYLHNGNTAIAGVQYSYLPSWISILADQETTKETSQVVFDTIHDHWSTLPEGSRPDIHLFGLSLGSFGVESILTSINIINEPIDGALLVGPPFVNDLWNEVTDTRDEGSPAWQPIYQEGRTVRFTALENALDNPPGEWQDTKVVYLQHASDPITFFSADLALSEPDWLKEGQRGPDVSDEMQWWPIVTMWQVAGDLPGAGAVPRGHGHLYKSREYLDGWIGISRPDRWTDEDTSRLVEILDAIDAENDAKD
jgi:uncharacterized membrane protein